MNYAIDRAVYLELRREIDALPADERRLVMYIAEQTIATWDFALRLTPPREEYGRSLSAFLVELRRLIDNAKRADK